MASTEIAPSSWKYCNKSFGFIPDLDGPRPFGETYHQRGDSWGFWVGGSGVGNAGEIDVMFGPKVVMPARCIYNLVHTCSYYFYMMYMVYHGMLPCGRPFWHLYTYIISIYTYLKIYQYIVHLPIYIHVSHTYVYIYMQVKSSKYELCTYSSTYTGMY